MYHSIYDIIVYRKIIIKKMSLAMLRGNMLLKILYILPVILLEVQIKYNAYAVQIFLPVVSIIII